MFFFVKFELNNSVILLWASNFTWIDFIYFPQFPLKVLST